MLVAFALMDADTTFEVVNIEQGEGSYLSANTKPGRTDIDGAGFIFAQGTEARGNSGIGKLRDAGFIRTPPPLWFCRWRGASARRLTEWIETDSRGPGVDGVATVLGKGSELRLTAGHCKPATLNFRSAWTRF